MTPIYESQLHELCAALGWHGGTYHQVLQEVARLRAINAQLVEALQRAADTHRDTSMYFSALGKHEGAEAYATAEGDARAAIAAATKDQP